jgi:hypothetical protein
MKEDHVVCILTVCGTICNRRFNWIILSAARGRLTANCLYTEDAGSPISTDGIEAEPVNIGRTIRGREALSFCKNGEERWRVRVILLREVFNEFRINTSSVDGIGDEVMVSNWPFSVIFPVGSVVCTTDVV